MATPNYLVTTGDFIAEWMESEGINAAELARRCGITPKHISELLSGKAPLSHAMSLKLEQVTGVPARIWNLYENGFRQALAEQSAGQSLAEQYERAKNYPLSYLRKQGIITATPRDHQGIVRQLLRFWGVADFDALEVTWRQGSVAYRRRALDRRDSHALATWLRMGELHGQGLKDIPPFDRATLIAMMPELRALTVGDPIHSIQQATQMLLRAGVVLCLTPPVPGLGIHGATRWLQERPLVQLSALMKSDDQLWFTLFHELGHVLLHGDKELYVFGDDGRAEDEANAYAAELLIPAEHEVRLPRTRSIAAIRALAHELGVAPSIVLGRAQRLTGDYAWGHDLRRKLVWSRGTGSL